MLGRHALALSLVSLVAMPAIAEQMGTIIAQFDGEPKEWFTISMERNGSTIGTATFGKSKFTADLHIQGHPRPSFTTKDVLSIDVSYVGSYSDGAAPATVEVVHLPDGMSGAMWTSDRKGEPAVVRFETLDIESGRAAGSFEARICKLDPIGDPDLTNCREISGIFDTGLVLE